MSDYATKCYPDIYAASACMAFLGAAINAPATCIDSGIPVAARDAGVTKCCYNDGLG